MADFNPSRAEITRAVITSYDGSKSADVSVNFIGTFDLVQSMNTVSYEAKAFIVDTANLLEGFPLRGEETIDLWVKCFDLDTEIKIKGRIYKVTDIQPSMSSNSISYTIHIVSETTFKASTRKIIAPFDTSISRAVRDVFNGYFASVPETGDSLDPLDRSKVLPYATQRYELADQVYERNFYIQPTVGVARFIIPDLSPTEAMYFLASKAYNPETPSQTFRFFETVDNFYFCTDEYFIKDPTKVHRLFYAPAVPNTPENIEAQLERVEEISILSKGIDVATDMSSGSYRNEVVELDLIRRKFDISQFNFDDARYIDMDGTPRDNSSNPHTEQFRTDVFTVENSKRFMIFKNFTGPGDMPSSLRADRHLAEIAHNRVSYYHHLNNTSLAVTMKGRLDIKPGEIADLDIKKLNSSGEDITVENDTLAGKYLIQSTVHSIDAGGTLTTTMRLAKFDWSLGTRPTESRAVAGGT